MDATPQLPTGFRFLPTDDELVVHYLRRRALDAPIPAAVDIPVVRILAHDPADLLPPGWSEPGRYFFTRREAKYLTGRRANRTTGGGYWKNTGKEKTVTVAAAGGQKVLVGMRRGLVFYRGRPPTGTRTDFVMHEYRLAGAGVVTGGEGWLLCRVFRNKGAAIPAAATQGQEAEEETEEEEEEMEEEEEAARPAPGFIDFFARAEAAEQQQRSVSSTCLTDE